MSVSHLQLAYFIGVLPKRQSLLLLLCLLDRGSSELPFGLLALLAASELPYDSAVSGLALCRRQLIEQRVLTAQDFAELAGGRLLPSRNQALAIHDALVAGAGSTSFRACPPLQLPPTRAAIASLLCLLGNRWAGSIWSRLSEPLASALLVQTQPAPQSALTAQFALLVHCFLSGSLDYELTHRLLDPRRRPEDALALRVANGLMLADGLRDPDQRGAVP